MDKKIKRNIEMPTTLFKQVCQAAAADNRSMNNYMVTVLETAIRQRIERDARELREKGTAEK